MHLGNLRLTIVFVSLAVFGEWWPSTSTVKDTTVGLSDTKYNAKRPMLYCTELK